MIWVLVLKTIRIICTVFLTIVAIVVSFTIFPVTGVLFLALIISVGIVIVVTTPVIYCLTVMASRRDVTRSVKKALREEETPLRRVLREIRIDDSLIWVLIGAIVFGFIVSSGKKEIAFNDRLEDFTNEISESNKKIIENEERLKETETLLMNWKDKYYISTSERVMESPKQLVPVRRPEPSKYIEISLPQDRTEVPERLYVEGTVIDPGSEVWVIIHPLGLSDYWVQPYVSVNDDGTWEVKTYTGRPGDTDGGKQFEIIAIANPTEELNEGEILNGWPDAQWSSEIVTVTRK